MSLFAAALGTIFGSIYFVLGDYRVLVAALVCLFISSSTFTSLTHRKKEILSFFIAFLLVFFNYNLRSEYLQYKDIETTINQKLQNKNYYLEIINKPKDNFFKSEFIAELKAVNPSFKERILEIFTPYRIIAKTDSSQGLALGDVISLADPTERLSLSPLTKIKAKIYKKDKVFYQAANKNIVYVNHKEQWIAQIQAHIQRYYAQHLSPENAQIITSLVLGSQVVELPKKFTKSIFNLGLGHLFSASGFNLMLLSLMLTWIAKILKLKPIIYSPLIIVASFIYTGLAGFSPSIVRADILITMFLILELMKRKPRSILLLVYLAAFLLALDPYTMFDLGFQLSYLATFAILIWATPISNKLKTIPYMPNYLTELISVTLAVQILLLPLILYYFNTLQAWSIAANLLLAPLFSVLTVVSFLGLYFIIEPLLNLFKYILKLSEQLPYVDSHVNVNFETFIFLMIVLNLTAYAFFKAKPAEPIKPLETNKLDDLLLQFIRFIIYDKYLRLSIITVSIAMILALNLCPPGIVKLRIEDGVIQGNKEIEAIVKNKKIKYKYIKVNNLEALVLNKRHSLKALRGLTTDIREVNLLIIPNLKEDDIYFDTLIELVKPQFVICSAKKQSPKVIHNIEVLGSHANTIVNSGILYIGHDKFWSITTI